MAQLARNRGIEVVLIGVPVPGIARGARLLSHYCG
jgi:hypothetical protein